MILRLFYEIPPVLIRIYPSLIFAFYVQFSPTNNQDLNQAFVSGIIVIRKKMIATNQCFSRPLVFMPLQSRV